MARAQSAGYTTGEIAALLQVSAARVRALVRAGFLTPARGAHRQLLFTFQDVVLLRTAQGLSEAKVPAQRIRLALQRLREELPVGRSLASVRIATLGTRLVVSDRDGPWEPDSGQRVLDFEVAPLAASAAPFARRSAESARAREADFDAEAWFALAVDLEAVAADEARDAYRRALELDPTHADSHINLGRLLHEAGNVNAALEHYRKASTLRTDDAIAHFNLGVALDDLGRLDAAAVAYRAALEADPALADAHFNLAGIFERLGKKAAAIRSWKSYRSLGPSSLAVDRRRQ
jgi:tetratricopeptide (TPR) repeat protein